MRTSTLLEVQASLEGLLEQTRIAYVTNGKSDYSAGVFDGVQLALAIAGVERKHETLPDSDAIMLTGMKNKVPRSVILSPDKEVPFPR